MPPRAQPTDPAKLLPSILRYLESSPPDSYSAHQKARTTAARLVHSGHHDEAIQVLFTSSKELLKVREWGSGSDLGCYLVEVYRTKEVGVDAESKGAAIFEAAFTGRRAEGSNHDSKNYSTTGIADGRGCMAKETGGLGY